MRGLLLLVFLFTVACATTQPRLASTEDALRYESTLEMSVPHPEVRAFTADGECVRVLHGWRVEATEPEVVLRRPDVGQIRIIHVGNSHQMILDLWAEQEDERRLYLDDTAYSPDCDASGCTVNYDRLAENGTPERVYVFQAGARHIVELSYPENSRNAQIAIADAVSTARQMGCSNNPE
jgi:hypothetical protein